jgi:hypothetical protein
MRIDIRILAVVTCFMIIAASAVLLVRSGGRGGASSFVEKIPPAGVATSGLVSGGVELQVDDKGLSLALPSCDTRDYRDKFFLHIYTKGDGGRLSPEFINMDFDLTKEKGKEVTFGGVKKCVFRKSFGDLAVKGIGIGQFTTPNGRCCDIIWSRFYLLDAGSRN